MNNTPELLRLADSITNLATSITDLVQAQIKAAVTDEKRTQTKHAPEAVADRSKPVPNAEGRLLCDIDQAADLLSVSPVSVRKLIRRNRLTRIPNFGKILISYDELRRFAASNSD